MNNPLISICIANYNKAPYIEQCLDSIINKEIYDNKEIIIIDDCSTDDSVKILEEWIEKNWEKIPVIFKQNIQNSGPGFTYNQAIQYSHGKYITFMDSDDFFIQDSLVEKANEFKKHKDLKIIYGNGVFFENNIFSTSSIHEGIQRTFRDYNFNPSKILASIYCKIPLLSLSSTLIKKEFITQIWGFDEKILSNDWILNIKIFQNLKSSKEFDMNFTSAFAYRIYENNTSKNYDRILTLLSQVIEKYCPKTWQNLWYSNIYFTNSLSNLSIWNHKKAFISIRKSIEYKFELKKILFFIIALIIPSKLLNLLPKEKLHQIKSIILRHFQ